LHNTSLLLFAIQLAAADFHKQTKMLTLIAHQEKIYPHIRELQA
jgi:hypothetical protein